MIIDREEKREEKNEIVFTKIVFNISKIFCVKIINHCEYNYNHSLI